MVFTAHLPRCAAWESESSPGIHRTAPTRSLPRKACVANARHRCARAVRAEPAAIRGEGKVLDMPSLALHGALDPESQHEQKREQGKEEEGVHQNTPSVTSEMTSKARAKVTSCLAYMPATSGSSKAMASLTRCR